MEKKPGRRAEKSGAFLDDAAVQDRLGCSLHRWRTDFFSARDVRDCADWQATQRAGLMEWSKNLLRSTSRIRTAARYGLPGSRRPIALTGRVRRGGTGYPLSLQLQGGRAQSAERFCRMTDYRLCKKNFVSYFKN
jgi:hypothetical protein